MLRKIRQYFCFHNNLGYLKLFHPVKHKEITIVNASCNKCQKIHLVNVQNEWNKILNEENF
jgi:hypothetical protein